MDLRNGAALSTRLLRVAGAALGLGLSAWVVVGSSTAAFADSQPYELYCPGTPVGNIALNNATTTGSLSPASPSSGQQFQVTNYQTTVNIPSSLVSAAAALGNTAIAGSAQTTINVTGATPASIKSPTLSFSVPIPSTVPAAGLTLQLPNPAGSIGPFTASGGAITVTQASQASLTLTVSGNPLALNCTAYANNTVATGITSSTPTGSAISPQITTGSASGAGGGGSTSTTAATTATTAAPSTSPGSSLATTGAGPGVMLLAGLGLSGLVMAGALMAGTRARAWAAASARGPSQRRGR